jgi:hypothetical protein
VAQDETITNKRSSDRRRIFKAGEIVLNQGGSIINCTVRNVSRTGAMLKVQNEVTVPQEFVLRWDGNVQHCTAVWRKKDGLGVRFDT